MTSKKKHLAIFLIPISALLACEAKDSLSPDPSGPPSGEVAGDLDGDGQATLSDLRLMVQMLKGEAATHLERADLDGDSHLTLEDGRLLVEILAA